MNSLVNYSVENQYEDTANIRINDFSDGIPQKKNENFKDIKRLKMKDYYSIVFNSIIIIIISINTFVLVYFAKSQIYLSNSQNGNFFLLYNNRATRVFSGPFLNNKV